MDSQALVGAGALRKVRVRVRVRVRVKVRVRVRGCFANLLTSVNNPVIP